MDKNSTHCRLWIGNLDSKLREYKLLKMVEKFGTLVEFDFLYHRSGPQQGQPRGYAFITFKKMECAEEALKTMDGMEVFGRKLSVKWAHAQDESKFVMKSKVCPTYQTSSKDISAPVTKRSLTKEGKIAALEAQLTRLEERTIEPAIDADIGGPSKPTAVFYNYIENQSNSNIGKYRNSHKSSSHHEPYRKNKYK